MDAVSFYLTISRRWRIPFSNTASFWFARVLAHARTPRAYPLIGYPKAWTPGTDGPKGRGHHPAVYSSWLAGGGVKGGLAHGESDEIGATVGRNKVHVHDFHATILHLLGLNHERCGRISAPRSVC